MIARTADVRYAAPAPRRLRPRQLAPPGLVAGMLAFAGLPLYIHVPRYFSLEIGFDLGVLGAVLGAGDVAAFYAVAAVSGAGLGADMTLTPAMLAARIRGGGAQVFSLWTFLQKAALAAAAGAALTLLGMAGYAPGVAGGDALRALAAGYALVPSGLKLLAMAALWLFVTDRGDRE